MPTTRRRPTEPQRETVRRSNEIAAALGRDVRSARRARRLTQLVLADRADVSQSTISDIERGVGVRTPLETWVALGVALGRPLAVSFTRPLGVGRDEPADAGHLAIQEHLLARARATGRHGTFELPMRPSDPRRSTDVGMRDDAHRVLILAEGWNTFGDLGAAVRDTHRKEAEVEAHAVASHRPDDAQPYRLASVWVVRASATNRALVGRYPHIIDAAFPGSSRRWVAALIDGAEPPGEPGFVWFDPATGRLLERRRG